MPGSQLLTELLSFGNLLFTFAKPVIFTLILALLLFPHVTDGKHDPWKVGDAIFCYLMEAIAIVLMSLGAIPTLMAVLGPQGFSPDLYLGLLLVFAAGGILYLWIDQHVRAMDEAVRLLPALIFTYTIKTVGYLLIVFSVLALCLAITSNALGTAGWWVVPLVCLAYGLLLCCLTATDQYRPQWLKEGAPKPKNKRPTKKKKK